MNVLVIAPHMDDEVLGVGGTICKHVSAGHRVKVLFLGNRVYNHRFDQKLQNREEDHARRAAGVLGYQEQTFARLPDERLQESFIDLLQIIERTVDDFRPRAVYVNHRNDPHQDHKAVFEASIIALRSFAQSDRIKQILCYEIPSSSDQAPPFIEYAFRPNYYVNVSGFIDKKIEAMGCYDTEEREFPHPRSNDAIRALAISRGTACYFSAAEAFMVLREEWD